MKETFNDWWSERAPRERVLISGAALVLLVALLYSVLWAPAIDGRASLRESLPTMQQQLAQMEAQAQEARSLSSVAAGAVPSGDGLRDALNSTLGEHGITGAQVTLVGTAVQVQLKNAPFASWVSWLDDVRKRFRVQVAQARVHALKADGQVDIDATLRPASSRSS